jgi:hypothetical protein
MPGAKLNSGDFEKAAQEPIVSHETHHEEEKPGVSAARQPKCTGQKNVSSKPSR